MKNFFVLIFLVTTITGGLSSERSAAYNPFSISTWLYYPSQLLQTWFPLFQSQYYPSYLQQRPQNVTPTGANNGAGNIKEEFSKPQTQNIFGVSESSCETTECLPPQKDIKW